MRVAPLDGLCLVPEKACAVYVLLKLFLWNPVVVFGFPVLFEELCRNKIDALVCALCREDCCHEDLERG